MNYFDEYLKKYDMNVEEINYKYHHSYRVMDNMELIAKGLELKEVKEIKVDSTEVTISGKTTKSEAKKETKKEVKEDKKEVKEDKKEEKVDYSAMKVAELKEIAASKNIDVTGMKKADIVAALEK